MARVTTPEAEALLDQEIRVLDKGFVRLVDYMGGDDRIVQAARVSYGTGTKTVREDKDLIYYLLRNKHSSPFEQVVLTFHLKMPIFVARQWVRHRTARMNEISGRYSVLSDEFHVPDCRSVRAQSTKNKQGRADEEMDPAIASAYIASIEAGQTQLYAGYTDYLKTDIARELARINLPLSIYTQCYWQMDLHNLFHFLNLRLNPHAQTEIRSYAEVLATCAQAVAPLAYAAFQEYILYSKFFSRTEMEVLLDLINGNEPHQLEGKALQEFLAKLGKTNGYT
ncbi:MAG: FAD-dependent thymidylate synthase [Methylococcales bacterium]